MKWHDDGVYVVSTGAQTPVGRSSHKAAAAVRCGLSSYQEHPSMVDREGEPMIVSVANWIPMSSSPHMRSVRLGVDAIQEALGSQSVLGTKLHVVVALSETTHPSEKDRVRVEQEIRSTLSDQGLCVTVDIVSEGNAVGVVAVDRAVLRLRNGLEQFVLVVGMDSHIGVEHLEAIDSSGRLHSVSNTWGFTPGEGAGAVLLTLGRVLTGKKIIPLAEIVQIAVSTEPKLLGTKTVCIGEGLSEAFRSVLGKDEKICYTYCDLNGETYRAEEFGFAVCRTRECFEDAGSFNAAAECWGDVGSASAMLQMVLATAAWSRGYAKGSNILCWSSSASAPLRGAFTLRNAWESLRKQPCQ